MTRCPPPASRLPPLRLLPRKESPLASEFAVAGAYQYDQRSLGGWIRSHVLRYWHLLLVFYLGFFSAWSCYAGSQVLIGRAADEIINPTAPNGLQIAALLVLAILVGDALSSLIGLISAETLAARFEADARQELYESLLGKSKTFHDRQRTGDIMARATDDASALASMIVPGALLASETVLGIVIPLTFIGFTHYELLLFPSAFVVLYIITARRYLRRLDPVITAQREQYGRMNASLEETISGIEVVKATAREPFEHAKYQHNARLFRDFFVQQGYIEARYLPLLLYGITVGLTFMHAMWLYSQGTLSVGQVIAVMGLVNVLRFPTFISIFAFSVIQAGLASARRILRIIQASTDLDENSGGHRAPLRGAIRFENVSFAYPVAHDEQNPTHLAALGQAQPDAGQVPAATPSAATSSHGTTISVAPPAAILHNITFQITAGQTVAIVGQTGSGKSALTQLVNRTYEATAGRVLLDDVDVRTWSLDALRSQIGKIEQDIFLFSRTLAENIAFGAPNATQEQIEAAARAAQAHDFISAMPDGYATVVGERGVTLSGGQRQRIALARAFLSDPRILILDDSTSAIDSATEDQIQQAIRKAQEGRTVLLITHRLSQIRWADQILVLDAGQLIAAGPHAELIQTCALYRRIFARYEQEAVQEVGDSH
ncbi:MAG: ABC transporter ATP-binding protein [Candidatus Viridilinea halotolerans]|uniref:ABC transporter ATP-binding protein n=1 Tax=Candidatus Viridilinea halotolerans TaxID=2491704 RepID=A0A426U4F3_9CHLR|nr:MAG: ABC transporter ATP-binding protein [Candidatus Viridilinea halotolerans]